MIRDVLEPLVCGRFLTDARYREGHLKVLNALPGRDVMGLHSPDMKEVAKKLTVGAMDVGGLSGMDLIMAFEDGNPMLLCYEEMAIWGFMINFVKCPVERKFEMLDVYVPVMDNWGVCDSYVAHAKWMKKVPADVLLAWLDRWFSSKREFEVRFAVIASMGYLIDHELDKVFSRIDAIDFDSIKSEYVSVRKRPEISDAAFLGEGPSGVPTGFVPGHAPYYVRMGVAWLLATALAKYPDRTRAYVRSCNLPQDVLKFYVRKARESFRTRDVSPY